ncbi:RF-1 domain-containing protein/PCRF domain-containing protein [Cephalotus follicularis]|uniref:RF-1 domain-containing protein/PCRF domain-containing protein n=1 Tax=Cephalotus follicularis TaxID=3775 RepID=A0A1Q3D9R5_CEPFO|nr:RF-1 domain-containing protein/PCRF domain-containing protein [Cephalotus follicularis]
MSSLIYKRLGAKSLLLSQNRRTQGHLVPFIFSSLSESHEYHGSIQNRLVLASGLSSFLHTTVESLSGSNPDHSNSSFYGTQSRHSLHADSKDGFCASGYFVSRRNISGFCSTLHPNVRSLTVSYQSVVTSRWFRLVGTQAAVEPSTSDELTMDRIVANQWTILDENENDWKSHAAAIAQSIQVIKRRLQWKKLMVRLDLLSVQLTKPDLWEDPVHAGKISREHGSLLCKMKEVKAFEQELLEHIDLIKLAREENDTELELQESLKALLRMRRDSKAKELEALLTGEQDSFSCYIEVQAGAGGTESMDWAAMVMQMYKSWAQRHGYGVIVVDEMPGEIAGIKRATIKVEGEYAFGYAKAEVGVHRLVRISPFDSGKRRHTSFAAVAVIPISGDGSTCVQINESDLRIERFRSGGAGGQHANTTDSAVRIVHIPTGVTATCQNERSQHQNKASAMAVLQSRVDQLEMARQAQMNAQHTQSLTDITWGSQIRSYVLHPYRMVKDLRTNYEVSNPDSVLEGDLDGFILSYLSSCLDRDEDD